MPLDAKCPKCNHLFPVTEERGPFTVVCPRCEAEMTAEFKKPDTPPEAGESPYTLVVKPGALADTTAMASASKTRNDDDDDEPQGKGSSVAIIILSGGLSMLLMLSILGVTGWFLFTQIDYEETVSNNSNNRSNNSRPNNNTRPDNNKSNNGGRPNGGRPSPTPGWPNDNNPLPPPPTPKPTTFNVNPVLGPLPKITPPPASLPASSVIDVGSKVGAVAVGGGGRYLVMHLPDKGQLMLFDANMATTSVAEVDTGNLLLAAGLSRVVVYVPGTKIFRVYSLPNLAKQFDASVQMVFDLGAIAMGSRTDGPLLGCNGFGETFLFSISGNQLTEIEAARGKPGIHGGQLRAAPTGNAFVSFEPHLMNQRVIILTESGKRWRIQNVGPVPYPGADGNFYGNGIVVDANGRDQRVGGIGVGSNTWYVPAVSGTGHFLKVAPKITGNFPREQRTLSVTIHANRNGNTPATGMPTFEGLPEFEGLIDRFQPRPAVTLDQHFFLIPEAKLLVVLNHQRNKLHLRRLDME